jgi:hypothetical protein
MLAEWLPPANRAVAPAGRCAGRAIATQHGPRGADPEHDRQSVLPSIAVP